MSEPVIATKATFEGLYDRAAEQYDQTGPHLFEQFGARLIEWLNIAPGSRMLDVATGRGAMLIPAARRAGATGRAVGVDLSRGMLEQAARAAQDAGLTNVEYHKMDAEHLEFADDVFDSVTCGFALFHFPAMDAATREMRRVCKPGGQIGITLWGKGPFDPAWKIFAEQVRAYDVEVRMPQRIANAPEDVRALLADAGWRAIEIQTETRDLVYTTEEDWWQFQFTMGSRAALERMDDATRARFRDEYLAKLRPLFRDDGLHLPAPVIYARAEK
ncbi:MAG: methyltransferase domain-containing protein [Chloroflexi bacterium]|nr:methyltransferase domain-containing protein [Chloroflexota bacterium]